MPITHVGLAEQQRSGGAQPRHRRGVARSRSAAEETRPHRRGVRHHVDLVLDGNGYTVEWPPGVARIKASLGI
jgi:hypothetical protein